MKHCWYSRFLLLSVTLFFVWTNGTTSLGKDEQSIETQEQEEKTKEGQSACWMPEVTKADGMAGEEKLQDAAAVIEYEGAEESDSLFPENFQETLFIGDSRTVGLYEYGDLGNADVFADSGMSVFHLWESKKEFEHRKLTLEQLLTERKYQTIHFMLGINELGYSMEQISEKYGETVKKIQDMQPQAKLILAANLHVTQDKSSASDIYNNQKIDELNEKIKMIGQKLSCNYIDINERFDDRNGNLVQEYSADGSHVLGKYYADWVQWLQEK